MKQVLITALLLFFSSFAQAGDFDRLDFLTEEYPPYNFRGDSGQLAGIAVDLLEETLKTMGSSKTRADFLLLPWARGYSDTLNPSQRNVLFSTTRTPERESLFKWAGPIAVNNVTVIALKDNSKTITSDAELKDYRYAVIRGDIAGILLGSKGVLKPNILDVTSFDALLRQLQFKRVDFIVYGNNVARWQMKKLGANPSDYKEVYPLDSSELYYAFNISIDDEVVDAYQKAIDQVRANQSFMDSIDAKYLD